MPRCKFSVRVLDVAPMGNSFQYSCSNGTRGTACKVLLASGLVDDLPAIAGIDEHYGISVHHCLYCDGFEYRGRAVAAYGLGDRGVLIRGAGEVQGPGRLGKALALSVELNGLPANPTTKLWFERGRKPRRIRAARRIGVNYAGRKWSERKLRFIASS